MVKNRKLLAEQLVEESVVLLKNENQLLPLQEGQTVAVFGRSALVTYVSGNGSGAARGAESSNIIIELEKAGISVCEELKQYYLQQREAEAANPQEEFDFSQMKEAVNSGLMYEIFGTYHAPVPEYPIPECLLTNVRDKTNTAILVLGRNAGGEECDRRLEGDYYLTEEEKKLVSHQINLVKSEPTAEAVLKKIKNPELKNLLENYRFTSANQIVVAMKEQGYTHKVRKGVHSFSREGERVSIRHKDLKKFADPKLESRHMEGIIERFNLYKYKQEGVAYRENGLEAKNISFLTYQKVPIEPEEDKSVTGKPETKEEAQQPQQETPGSEAHPEETENEAETPMPEPDPVKYRKELKEVSYDVLFDRETKTYVPISAIRKYAYENEINLIDRYKHGYAVRNEDLRECLANPEYRTVRQINKAMRERGYTIERDEAGNYTYIKGESSFFMERRDLLAFTGYAKDTGGRERERGTHRSADKTVGFIGGKAKQKLINEILGDSFRTERMLVGNVKKAVSLIQNPANIKMMLIKQIGSFLNPFKEL